MNACTVAFRIRRCDDTTSYPASVRPDRLPGVRVFAAPKTPAPERPAPEIDVEVAEEERLDDPWRVILYNDDVHSFDEVILQLVKATGCTINEAERMAWQVHQEGKGAVYEGTFEACFRVQGILREIQLVTEIQG